MSNMITVTVKNHGSEKTTRVNLKSIKKSIDYDSEYDTRKDVYTKCIERAIDKLYGKG